MGKPPQSGSPAFRFTSSEVAEMEAFLQENKVVPTREIVCSIAEKFSASPDRAGKIVVQSKQVWNWFQNRRYAQKAKLTKAPGKLNVSSMPQDDLCFNKTRIPVSAGRTHSENYVSIGYEAKSAKDGAWYDVGSFINNRKVETGNPEVLVRFGGFGEEEDEWLDVRTQIRPSSIPCEPSECAVVLPGDLILCFLEGKEQALYMDAHVVDVQRWRHDVRGCRCRFTVRYDHDQSEEVVSLRKLCRRPETDFRLQLMYASKDLGSVNLQDMKKDPSLGGTSKDFNSPKTRKNRRQKGKASEMVVNTIPSSGTAEPITTEAARIMKTENFDDGKVGISGERIGGAPVIFSTAATSTGSGSGGFGGSGTGAGKST